MTSSGMRTLFFVLGLVAGIAALVLGNEHRENIPAAGAACGFAVSAGLCMIAAAIVFAWGETKKQ